MTYFHLLYHFSIKKVNCHCTRKINKQMKVLKCFQCHNKPRFPVLLLLHSLDTGDSFQK